MSTDPQALPTPNMTLVMTANNKIGKGLELILLTIC